MVTRHKINDGINLSNTGSTEDINLEINETYTSLESQDSSIDKNTPNIEKSRSTTTLASALKSKVFIISIVFSAVLLTVLCIAFLVHYEIDSEVNESVPYWKGNLPAEQNLWYDKGIEELRKAINIEINTRRARNVIIFVGDGMGPNTVTASRILGFKEDGLMSWENFPHMGMLKTYCADKQVPDSFSTGTALFSGVKVNYETGGVDSSVQLANCTASLNSTHHVDSIIHWAQVDGMNTGFVTTTRVTHATPASLYAHVSDRRWECEEKMPEEALNNGCKDIGRMLVEDEPGKNINVIMGGGRQCLQSNVEGSNADPIDTWACNSKDGRDLISKWENQKESDGVKYAVVKNNKELNDLNPNTEFVLGVFANGHLKYDYEIDKNQLGMPSLKEMTIKALDLLRNKDKGFLLVVEGGMIDQAHHRGAARKALSETLALNEAVEATVQTMKDVLDETLIIVTADHSHTLTINGYPERGSSILGTTTNEKGDGIPYTTLTYGTSHDGFQVEINPESVLPVRKDPSKENTMSYDYIQQSAIKTDENTHGGSDVTIHAMGPMAHLFHRVHEQSYVAHAISYALRIGRFRDSSIVESLADFVS